MRVEFESARLEGVPAASASGGAGSARRCDAAGSWTRKPVGLAEAVGGSARGFARWLTACVRRWQVEEDKIATIIKDLDGKDVSQINEMIAEYGPVPALAGAPPVACVRLALGLAVCVAAKNLLA